MRAFGTFVKELSTQGPFINLDFVKQTVPEWSGNFSINYSLGRFNTTAQVRYIGPAVVDVELIGPDQPGYSPALSNSISDYTRPSVMYLNLSGQYRLLARDDGTTVQLYAIANNVLDKDPLPFGGSNPVGASLYDLVGRAFKVGLRFAF